MAIDNLKSATEMRYKKTYVMDGKLECLTTIDFGGRFYEFHFQGGVMSELGSTGAQYTTESDFYQLVIQSSVQYRQGKIRLAKAEPLEEISEEQGPSEKGGEVSGFGDRASGTSEKGEATSEGQEEVMEVTCLSDARRVCMEEWGYKESSVRKRDDVMKAGRKHGVCFVIND